ncbi:helix-turn-helix domain-containing protein [Piscinibacter sakaiensis]
MSQVAKELGVSRNTLYRRMHRLHIPVTPPRAA